MVWEIVFMLLILKIPIVYLCVVVWWAIKAEPLPPDLAAVAAMSDTPPSGGSPRRTRVNRRRPVRPHTPGRRSGASPPPQRGGVRS
jgi:hypothetical protein